MGQNKSILYQLKHSPKLQLKDLEIPVSWHSNHISEYLLLTEYKKQNEQNFARSYVLIFDVEIWGLSI